MPEAFILRPMTKDDEGFVYRAWLEGYWQHCPESAYMPKSEWFCRWHRVIERLLEAEATQVQVAHVENQPDVLLGFACATLGVLHWAYVKQTFRGLGVAQSLISALALEERACSHWAPHLASAAFTYRPGILKEILR